MQVDVDAGVLDVDGRQAVEQPRPDDPVTVATRSEPTTSPRISRAAPATPSTAATAVRAWGTSDDPADVRATRRAERSISEMPSSRSSFWIWVLMPD